MIINETPEQPIGRYIRKRGILYYIERKDSNGSIKSYGRYPSLIQAQHKLKKLENTKWKTKKKKPVENNYKNCKPGHSAKKKKQSPIKCKNCGQEFIKRGNNQKFCSNKCKKTYNKNSIQQSKKCIHCGEEFKPRARQRICDKCKERKYPPKNENIIDKQTRPYIKKIGSKYLIIHDEMYMGCYSCEYDAVTRCHELIENNWEL